MNEQESLLSKLAVIYEKACQENKELLCNKTRVLLICLPLRLPQG